MKIKVLSDSTCDLSQELLDKNDIPLTRLTVVNDTGGVDITPGSFAGRPQRCCPIRQNETAAGCIVSCRYGPSTLGILFVKK